MDNRISKRLYTIFALFFAITLSVSIYSLVSHQLEKNKAEKDFEKIREVKEYTEQEEKVELVDEKVEDNAKNIHIGNKKWYENLYLENSDMMCWIKQKDANIDYPVMYSNRDSEYYLRRDFYKNYSISGTPFFDIRTPLDEDYDGLKINIIYGHNMKDGTMFSDLKILRDKENIEKAAPIIIETLNNKYEYKIFASLIVKEYTKLSDRIYKKISFKDRDDYDRYIKMLKNTAKNILDDIPNYGDDILLLSTCTSNVERGRLIIFAIKQESR